MDGRDWLTLTIYLVQALLVVSMAVVVLRENRQPVKTMAWLLVLSFIPVVGIVLFIFFGKDVRKEKYISRHSLDLLTRQSMLHYVEQGAIVESEPHAELIRLFENQNVALPFGDNQVKVLADGYEFFPALLQAMKNAKEHIHLVELNTSGSSQFTLPALLILCGMAVICIPLGMAAVRFGKES